MTVNGERRTLDMLRADPGCHEIRLNMPETPAIVQYFFYLQNFDGAGEYYGNAWDGLGGIGVTCGPEPVPYQITVYDPAYSAPSYLREGVMYQIFPDRFFRERMPVTDRTNCMLHTNWEDVPVKRVAAVKDKAQAASQLKKLLPVYGTLAEGPKRKACAARIASSTFFLFSSAITFRFDG